MAAWCAAVNTSVVASCSERARLRPPARARPQAVRTSVGDPLRCTDRAATPLIDNAYDAHWAPDSKSLVVSRIVTVPNPRMITGYEEDQRLLILNVTTGQIRDLGQGSKASWS